MDPTLLPEIEAFLERHSMRPTTFGRGFNNDVHFVRQLREGRRVWPETAAKARAFMAARNAALVEQAA